MYSVSPLSSSSSLWSHNSELDGLTHLVSDLDIEQSIQNALALFNSKDITGGIGPFFVIDDPIVSLHDPNTTKSKNIEIPDSKNAEIRQIISSPKNLEKSNNQNVFSDFPFSDTRMSHESISLPFLQNPITSTIAEMQRVLNAKGDIFSPRNEPSPEEILNLYSQDLGISPSNNASPRGDLNLSDEHHRAKLSKKDKKINKKHKQQKLNLSQDKKTDIKKGKISKSETLTSQENKLKELMNIYGCSEKIRKPHSDSTLGSKSGISRKNSTKKVSHKNDSSKANSVAPSKKSKRKKQKNLKQDVDLCDEDFAVLEKSSRLSTKRKKHNTKTIKKPNLKRKMGSNLSNDIGDLKLSKSHQISYRDQKASNHNYLAKDNSYRQQKQLRQKSSSQTQHEGLLYRTKGPKNIEDDVLMKSNNKSVLNPIPYTKQHYGVKNNLKLNGPEIQNIRNSIFHSKKTQSVDNENVTNSLINKTSEETKLSRHVLFMDNGVDNENNFFMEDPILHNSQMSYDNMNEDFIGQQTQLHYALPTQSSRSKEVERFLNGHYQHLPFVIGQSTNKSHNLWVNIQEALSLIKQKVPQTVEVQSFTQDGESERPLSVLSKSTLKSTKKPHQCPAHGADGLYDIPEGSTEVEEAAGRSWEDHPECIQANIDPTSVRPRCSCTSQPSLSYKKVLRQIFGGATDASDTSVDMNGAREDVLQDQGGDNYTAELRKALVSFTQEFEELNNKYEEMIQDPNASKEELQRLEMYLENKEEEIREIIARFNEVKEFSERAARLDASKSRAAGLNTLEPYKSTTSIRLAQTLRRVQQFKESLRSRPSGPHLSKNLHTQSSY